MPKEPDQQITPAPDEIFLDLRKLTMWARGKEGLAQVPKILCVLVLALIVSLVLSFTALQMAARQSPSIWKTVERVSERG